MKSIGWHFLDFWISVMVVPDLSFSIPLSIWRSFIHAVAISNSS
jgi:hypothetical protein